MGIVLLYLIIIVALICFWWYIANQFYEAAKAKGHYDRKYLHLCFWFGIIGYLLVIALPDRGAKPADNGNSIGVLYDELPDL